jgi:hypothetical protein
VHVTRVQRRPLAWLALCAVLCSVALPVLEAHPIGAADDAACRFVTGSSDNGGSRIATQESRQAPEHCVVCHLQRALGGAFVSDVAALTAPFQAVSCLGLGESHPLSAACAAPSSRGPPALLSI